MSPGVEVGVADDKGRANDLLGALVDRAVVLAKSDLELAKNHRQGIDANAVGVLQVSPQNYFC